MSRPWDSSHFNEEPLSKPFVISIGAHLLLAAIFGIKIAFFEEPEIDLTQAIRVDMVGLPEKMTELPKPAEKSTESAPEKALPEKQEPKTVAKEEKEPEIQLNSEKKSDSKAVEKTKAKQSDAIAKLKQMQALESLNKITNSATPAPVFKGAVITPGTSLTGLAKLQHQSYIADLDQHIKSNWALPEWLLNKNLKAQIRVYLDSKGQILNRKIVRSSGNPAYDAEVIATVERSAPFPAPPEKFTAIVSIDGILIGFPE